MDKFTYKQKRFIEEYAIDGNATQAAVRSGYSEKTAGVIGDENLKKPYIKREIEVLQKRKSQEAEITSKYVLNGIKSIADNPEAKDSDKLKAFELLGKNLQLFTDVTKQVLPEGFEEIRAMVIKYKGMSNEDLQKILDEGKCLND